MRRHELRCCYRRLAVKLVASFRRDTVSSRFLALVFGAIFGLALLNSEAHIDAALKALRAEVG
jgi:hypothetical protein